jgi:hypothetical protein
MLPEERREMREKMKKIGETRPGNASAPHEMMSAGNVAGRASIQRYGQQAMACRSARRRPMRRGDLIFQR